MSEKELPRGWVESELENLFNLVYGKGLRTSELIEEGYPVYGANGIIGRYSEFIREESKVIISCRGAGCGIIHKTKPNSFITSNSIILDEKSPNLMNLSFIEYAMNAVDKSDVITGTAQPQITIQLLKDLKFPLPPLPEQQRIVAKLDSLFARIEKLKSGMERIPQLLKDFRQAVLIQAVTGKLTEEWREGRDLKEINLIQNKYKIEFEFIEKNRFPDTWEYVALGNFAECSRGKFTARPRNDPQFFDGKYPFMQIGDLPENGGLFYSYSSTLNEKGKSVSKSFSKGTVVIAIVGATIGNTGILKEEVFFPDSLIGINSKNTISNIYIEYFLRCVKNKIRELSYAGGGQPNIKLPNITNLGISIPPLEEQKEIVHWVESLFAKADKLEVQYQTLKEKLDQLPQALLAKAFRGELVEQLPTDGDARELLEEIKKAKQEKPILQKRRSRKAVSHKPTKKMDIESVIKDNFKDEAFSFEELFEVVKGDYEAIQKAVFKLLKKDSGWGLIQEFDVEKEQMMLKSKIHETK